MQASQSNQLRLDGGQGIEECQREESLCGAVLSVIRANLAPTAQQSVFVAGLGAEVAQALAEVGDT